MGGVMNHRKLLVMVVVLLLAGCATVKRPDFTELLWPPPPQTSRIKFEGLLINQNSLGRTGGELFLEILVGKNPQLPRLEAPMALTTSRDAKRLYVSDYAKQAVFIFDFESRQVSFLQSSIYPFKKPFGVAVDGKDNVYVADSEQKLIRVFDPKGNFVRDIRHDGFERPTGLAIDASRQRLYVADSSFRTSDNHFVHIFDLSGSHLKTFGGRAFDEKGKFYFPTYLAVDKTGNLYVTDTLNSRVQVFDSEGQYIKQFGVRGDRLGMFDKPKGVALDSFGNVYVVDSTWSNVQIFNQKEQILLYFAGRGRIPGLLFNPTGITLDKNNRIYIADLFNGRVAIYQLINTEAEDSFVTLTPQTEKGGDASKTAKKGGGRKPR
jgi:DNA-binding beta-propeller fold protein YncE